SPLSISAIMKPNPVFALVTDEAIDAVHKINDYGIGALPVLDQGKMVGIITIDDAMDVVHDDATENFGMLASYVTKPAEESSLKKSLLKRLPWLTVLLLLSLLVSNVTKIFEGIIQQVTVLIFFQSMILDMAGNAGTQTLAVAIRSLERNELNTRKNIRKHFFKEFRISLLDSFALALFSFFICTFFLWSRESIGINIGIVSMIIAVSLFLSLLLSGLMASSLPIFFHRVGIDPSVASGPFITTLNDIFSTVIYFGLAFLFFSFI
ncbi:MAG TPA: magnesium transporter, partial [Acholeplasmatales bacterium]|nr:magnesium transporter [Acholeplasmatales bacterium]